MANHLLFGLRLCHSPPNDIQFFDVASQLDYLQVESVFDTLYEQELDRAYDQGLMEQRILERQEQEFGEFLSNVSFGAYQVAGFIPIVGAGISIYENGGVILDSNASLTDKAYASGNIVFDLFGGKLVKKVGGVLVAGGKRLSGPVKNLLGFSDEAAEAALRKAPSSNVDDVLTNRLRIQNKAQQARDTAPTRGLGGRTLSPADRVELNQFADRARTRGYTENPHRTGSFGEIIDGKFKERVRIDIGEAGKPGFGGKTHLNFPGNRGHFPPDTPL